MNEIDNQDELNDESSLKNDRLSLKLKKKEEGKRRAMNIAKQRRLLLEQEINKESNNRELLVGESSKVATTNTRKKRHGARNQHRHKFFVRWLVKKFPHIQNSGETSSNESLSQQEHVLDVAGGKGELSARLTMCHNVKVVMIDPRESHVEKCFNELVFKSLPKKWQQRIVQRKEECPSKNFVGEQLKAKFHQLIQPFHYHSVNTCQDMKNAVERSSLLIGLHADAATEDIVDVALAYGKPFVVVPCCVFPNFFKTRRLIVEDSNSQTTTSIPVRTHEQFCKYLLQKDPRFKMETLPFEGRNIAIWWEGPLKQ